MKLNKAASGAGLSDLVDNALDKLCLGFLGGLCGRVSGQHRLDNSSKAKVTTVLVADLSSSNNNIKFRWVKVLAEVGDIVVARHD